MVRVRKLFQGKVDAAWFSTTRSIPTQRLASHKNTVVFEVCIWWIKTRSALFCSELKLPEGQDQQTPWPNLDVRNRGFAHSKWEEPENTCGFCLIKRLFKKPRCFSRQRCKIRQRREKGQRSRAPKLKNYLSRTQDLVQDVLQTFVRLHLVCFESKCKRRPLSWCGDVHSYKCSFETVVYDAVFKDIEIQCQECRRHIWKVVTCQPWCHLSITTIFPNCETRDIK